MAITFINELELGFYFTATDPISLAYIDVFILF